MTTEQNLDAPTPEEIADAPIPVPVKIHMDSGKTFVVSKIGGWKYEDVGVFASGHFTGYTGEIDILIPYNRVEYYEFDFPALRRYMEKMEALRESIGS